MYVIHKLLLRCFYLFFNCRICSLLSVLEHLYKQITTFSHQVISVLLCSEDCFIHKCIERKCTFSACFPLPPQIRKQWAKRYISKETFFPPFCIPFKRILFHPFKGKMNEYFLLCEVFIQSEKAKV